MKSAQIVGIAVTTFALGALCSALVSQDSATPGKEQPNPSTHSIARSALPQATGFQTALLPSSNTADHCSSLTVNDSALRQDIARVLRDELRSVLASANAEVEHARREEAARQEMLNSPENREAYHGALDLVQFALATKRWTEDDAQALRAALTHLTQEQAAEVFERLIPAINRGELAVDTDGPPF
jgi:hypothetical protein